MKARRRRARRKGGGWWRGEKGWGCGLGTRSLGSHSSHAVPSLPSLAALASTVAILGSPSMRHPHNSPRLLIAHPLSPSVFHRLQSHQNRPLLRVSHDYTVPDTTRRDEDMCDVGFLALGTAHGPLTHARALTGVREYIDSPRQSLLHPNRPGCLRLGAAHERPETRRMPDLGGASPFDPNPANHSINFAAKPYPCSTNTSRPLSGTASSLAHRFPAFSISRRHPSLASFRPNLIVVPISEFPVSLLTMLTKEGARALTQHLSHSSVTDRIPVPMTTWSFALTLFMPPSELQHLLPQNGTRHILTMCFRFMRSHAGLCYVGEPLANSVRRY